MHADTASMVMKNLSSFLLLLSIGHLRVSRASGLYADCRDNITLMHGKSSHEGIPVLCLGEERLAACDDNWGQLETDAACRQLGFDSGETIENFYEWLGSLSPVLNCSQDYTTLTECVTDRNCKGNFLPGILCHHPSFTSSVAIPGSGSIVQPSATSSVPVTRQAIPGTGSIVPSGISSPGTGSIVPSGMSSPGTDSVVPSATSSIPATGQETTHTPQSTPGYSPYDITTTTATPPTTPTQPLETSVSRTPLPTPRPSGPTHLGGDGAGGDGYPPEAVAFLSVGLLCVVLTSAGIVGVAVVILTVRLRQRRVPFRPHRCGPGSDDFEIQNTMYSNSEACSDPVRTDDVTYTEHCPVYDHQPVHPEGKPEGKDHSEDQPVYEDMKSVREEFTRSQSILNSDIFDDKTYFRTSEFI